MTFPAHYPYPRLVRVLDDAGYRPRPAKPTVSVIRPESVTVDPETGKITDYSRAIYAPISVCPEGLEPFTHHAWGAPEAHYAQCPCCDEDGALVCEPLEGGVVVFCTNAFRCPSHEGATTEAEVHEALWGVLKQRVLGAEGENT